MRRAGGRSATCPSTELLHTHGRTGLLHGLFLDLLLLLPRLSLLLLELLHRLWPLRATLLHRRVHRLHRADITQLVEKVVAGAGRPLRAPDRTGIRIQGDLIDALQAIRTRLDRQGGGELIAALIRRTPVLLIQLMNQIARPQIERMVRVGGIIEAPRALPGWGSRIGLGRSLCPGLSLSLPLFFKRLQCVSTGDTVDGQAVFALESLDRCLGRRTKIFIRDKRKPIRADITKLRQLGLKIAHGIAPNPQLHDPMTRGVTLRSE